jgi:hypothetical protein
MSYTEIESMTERRAMTETEQPKPKEEQVATPEKKS